MLAPNQPNPHRIATGRDVHSGGSGGLGGALAPKAKMVWGPHLIRGNENQSPNPGTLEEEEKEEGVEIAIKPRAVKP